MTRTKSKCRESPSARRTRAYEEETITCFSSDRGARARDGRVRPTARGSSADDRGRGAAASPPAADGAASRRSSRRAGGSRAPRNGARSASGRGRAPPRVRPGVRPGVLAGVLLGDRQRRAARTGPGCGTAASHDGPASRGTARVASRPHPGIEWTRPRAAGVRRAADGCPRRRYPRCRCSEPIERSHPRRPLRRRPHAPPGSRGAAATTGVAPGGGAADGAGDFVREDPP